jgi:hypothetical protein
VSGHSQTSGEQAEEGESQVFCRQLDGRTINLTVNSLGTIGKMKVMVAHKTGVPAECFVLARGGKILEDEWLVHACDIRQDSTIEMRSRLRGAGPTGSGPSAHPIDPAQLFASLDKNGDGKLSRDELVEGLSNEGLKEWEIDGMLKGLDVNDDGQISQDEWRQAFARSEAALRAAGEKGLTDIKATTDILKLIMMRPESIDFGDVRSWTRIQLERHEPKISLISRENVKSRCVQRYIECCFRADLKCTPRCMGPNLRHMLRSCPSCSLPNLSLALRLPSIPIGQTDPCLRLPC